MKESILVTMKCEGDCRAEETRREHEDNLAGDVGSSVLCHLHNHKELFDGRAGHVGCHRGYPWSRSVRLRDEIDSGPAAIGGAAGIEGDEIF